MPAPSQQETKQAIDEIIATLFINDASGYFGATADPNVVRSVAVERIRKRIATLDERAAKEVDKDTRWRYRLEQFGEFSELSKEEKERLLRVAKEEHVLVEDAYASTGTARS